MLGKDVQYKQVDFEEFSKLKSGGRSQAGKELAGDRANEFAIPSFQHLKEVAIDHQNGVFEGTNDLVEKLGGRPPMTLEAFIEKHRAAFE